MGRQDCLLEAVPSIHGNDGAKDIGTRANPLDGKDYWMARGPGRSTTRTAGLDVLLRVLKSSKDASCH